MPGAIFLVDVGDKLNYELVYLGWCMSCEGNNMFWSLFDKMVPVWWATWKVWCRMTQIPWGALLPRQRLWEKLRSNQNLKWRESLEWSQQQMVSHHSPKKTQMVLDLRQSAGTPSGSEETELTSMAKAQKNGRQELAEARQYLLTIF